MDFDVRNEDGKYVFVGKLFETAIVNKTNMKRMQEVLSMFPRLDNTQLPHAEDGVYTWLLYSTGNSSEASFVATKVISPFEIGTRHQALAYNARIDASTIYGGGELIKKDGKNMFNLLSGTYSRFILINNIDKIKKKK